MSDSARTELPPRRLNTTVVMQWGSIEWLVTLGWDVRGKVAEIFCEGVKETVAHRKAPCLSETDWALTGKLRATAHDICILISHLLQTGRDVVELHDRLAPNAIRQATNDLTLPCALLRVAVERQTSDGAVIVQAYRAAAGENVYREDA